MNNKFDCVFRKQLIYKFYIQSNVIFCMLLEEFIYLDFKFKVMKSETLKKICYSAVVFFRFLLI